MNPVLIVFIVVRIGVTIGYWKLFEKAGIEGWKSLIPFYSEYVVITEIVGKPWWWFLYLLIPVINIIVFYVLLFDMLKCYGRRTLGDQILAAVFGMIYLPYLGFNDKVRYIGKLDQLPQVQKTKTNEWVEAILFAVVAATLIRWLIMEAYTIPTPSMENSLLVGDFLFVSKFHYGTRTTSTPLQMPLTHQKIWFTEVPSYLDWVRLPQYRLPGISSIKRNDVVVFNVPPRELNDRDYPVDLKTNYIKRAVAIAGDTLEIVDKQVIINGKPLENPPLMQFSYLVTSNTDINRRIFDKYEIDEIKSMGYDGRNVRYQMFISPDIAEELKKLPFVVSVQQAVEVSHGVFETRTQETVESNIFPNYERFPWNGDFFGPLVVPKEGMTITMDEDNIARYGSTIVNYDLNEDARIENGKLVINGQEVNQYTFKQNYYFMMGDNRHNSLDSRYWGFVPEDHVVGKAFFIWLSLDSNADFLNKIRWSRFFKLIR